MKKLAIALISIIIAVALVACTNQNDPLVEIDGPGMANPITDSSISEIEKELELSSIKFDNDIKLGALTKIAGDPLIYSIDIEKDNTEYNLRICTGVERTDDDISGVYLDGKIEQAIFDSANEYIAPSVSCEASSSGTKAYSSWMGYIISLSADKKINLDEFQAIYNNLAKSLLNSKMPKLIFEKNDSEGGINIEYDTGEYKIKSVDGKPMILFGDVAYSIKDAVETDAISADDIVLLCGMPAETYKDGGSQVFSLDDCTIIKMNTLDGNKDLIIGPKGADLYNK